MYLSHSISSTPTPIQIRFSSIQPPLHIGHLCNETTIGETRETRKTGGDGKERRREKEKIKKKKKEIDRCRRRRLRRTLFTGTKLDTSRGIHREARGKSEKEAEEEAAWNGKGHTVREV